LLAEFYGAEYEAVFGPLPDLSDPRHFPPHAGPVSDRRARQAWETMRPADQRTLTQIYVNLAKAVAAYQRQIIPGPSRFDLYLQALQEGEPAARRAALTPDEVAGARIFIGQGECILCHNGPLLTNFSFHNIASPGITLQQGRISAIEKLQRSEFTCLGPYSDAAGPADCAELRFMRTSGHEIEGALRTPTLRNLAHTAPYFHNGEFESLAQMLEFYNDPPPPPTGHSELRLLNLTPRQLQQLEAFLLALDSPLQVDPRLVQPLD
jgi:cytochrome c peroxidase